MTRIRCCRLPREPFFGMEGRRSTSDAPGTTQAKALVAKSGGSVRPCVAANRRMADWRALCAGLRIDGSVVRDVSRSVPESGTITNATASGQGVASRACKRTDSGRRAKVRRCASRSVSCGKVENRPGAGHSVPGKPRKKRKIKRNGNNPSGNIPS